MSINSVNISGNLTRDPELRQTQGGTSVLRLGLAVNDRARNQQTGEWEDRANFVDCVVFGKRAEALAGMLAKGQRVAIDGRLRYSSWQDKEGNRRSKLEVVVDEIDIMSARTATQPSVAAAPVAPAPVAPAPVAPADVYDEDIPF